MKDGIKGALVLIGVAGLVALGFARLENRDELMDVYGQHQIDKLADSEAAATILAKDRARLAFEASTKPCGPAPLSSSCTAEGVAAAKAAARTTLLDGGCINWEMSEWDPSRGLAERVEPKSRDAAESECETQAAAIADRLAK